MNIRHVDRHVEKRRSWYTGLFCAGLSAAMISAPLSAGDSWFSKARIGADTAPASAQGLTAAGSDRVVGASTDAGTTVFDITISLHNNPETENERDPYEAVIEHFADSVCEQSNGASQLGTVRVFTNGGHGSRADIIWNEEEWPRASIAGFGSAGRHIWMGDIFPDGCGNGCDYDMLADAEGAGYTLGHEWGHYVLALYDEYEGRDPAENRDTFPQVGDVPTSPAIMNSQWQARGGNYEWLNHSTSDNIGDPEDTAQGRVYGKSGWEVLVQPTTDDPQEGNETVQPDRTRYTALEAVAPTAADNWVVTQLDQMDHGCRDELEIVWMDDDLEISLIVDTSGSMSGAPIINARTAGRTLVDVVEPGRTAMGVVRFSASASVVHPMIAIPDPGTAEKDQLKDAIDSLPASGLTAMFDGLILGLDELQDYSAANDTDAGQVAFLLSDGGDNSSAATEPQTVQAYQDANVPIIAFGYGSFAPTGVLRRLADNTGGEFFASPTTLAEIQEAFLAANAAVSDAVNLSQESQPVAAGANERLTFTVDPTLGSMTVLLNFTGSADQLSPTLLDSDGNDTGIPFSCDESADEVSCLATVDRDAVSAGGVGDWTVDTGENTSGGEVEVLLNVVANPADGRTFDVRVSTLGGSTVEYPSPALISAAISAGRMVSGVNVVAELTDPDGNVTTVPLNDEGQNGDAEAGDGIYSAVVNYRQGGTHELRVRVDNQAGTGQFVYGGVAPAPDINGMEVQAPDPEPIPENFQRVATTQFTVDGFQDDDHADDPALPGACTPLEADNTTIPGRIDAASDRDCFRLVGTSVPDEGDVSLRVASFGLGMQPIVTIYTGDGSEVLLTFSLDDEDFVARNGYLYTVLDRDWLETANDEGMVGGAELQDLVVTVEHEDETADEGTYKVSAGSVISSDQPAEPDRITDEDEEEFEMTRRGSACSVAGNSAGGPADPTLPLLAILALLGVILGRRRHRA
ncbi:vWA domain-containing protein [Alkalilimnicola ehrlichii MLHE-1]|uniref:von Willebrand factor, type A n=1 Tax=Alkalilimnicola ehrlichii (strain ATCC BAA-1101 / DSM 17681 / MLHE-1) TaxID=187272 RepID=Q0A603_ALKEH|nr:VWA domain-containing protein [Alkalilimnicola ehrlichii]ABI57734.1 von Willebrand factor, type A [Alkalilimnicola ehrlichii MLHE-1]